MIIKQLLAPIFESTMSYNADRKSPMGDSKEWMEKMGITKDMFPEIHKRVRASAEYKELIANGWVEQDTKSTGGTLKFTHEVAQKNKRPSKIIAGIQPWGKTNFTHPNRMFDSRWPAATGKPRVVPGKPVESAVSSMTSAMAEVVKLTKKRADMKPVTESTAEKMSLEDIAASKTPLGSVTPTFGGKEVTYSKAKGIVIPGVEGLALKVNYTFYYAYENGDVDIDITFPAKIAKVITGGFETRTGEVLQYVKLDLDTSKLDKVLMASFQGATGEAFVPSNRKHAAWMRAIKKEFKPEALVNFKSPTKISNVDGDANKVGDEIRTNLKDSGFIVKDASDLF